jgi:hypothetical protein
LSGDQPRALETSAAAARAALAMGAHAEAFLQFERVLALGRQAVAELSDSDPLVEGLARVRLVDWARFAEQGDDAQRLIDRAVAVIPARALVVTLV